MNRLRAPSSNLSTLQVKSKCQFRSCYCKSLNSLRIKFTARIRELHHVRRALCIMQQIKQPPRFFGSYSTGPGAKIGKSSVMTRCFDPRLTDFVGTLQAARAKPVLLKSTKCKSVYRQAMHSHSHYPKRILYCSERCISKAQTIENDEERTKDVMQSSKPAEINILDPLNSSEAGAQDRPLVPQK